MSCCIYFDAEAPIINGNRLKWYNNNSWYDLTLSTLFVLSLFTNISYLCIRFNNGQDQDLNLYIVSYSIDILIFIINCVIFSFKELIYDHNGKNVTEFYGSTCFYYLYVVYILYLVFSLSIDNFKILFITISSSVFCVSLLILVVTKNVINGTMIYRRSYTN